MKIGRFTLIMMFLSIAALTAIAEKKSYSPYANKDYPTNVYWGTLITIHPSLLIAA